MKLRFPTTTTVRSLATCLALACVPLRAGDEFGVNQLDQPARPVSQVLPVYPFAMHAAGLEGRVTVDFTIASSGRVLEAHIVRSNNPWFERPALDAVMKWTFKPGKKNGRAVNTRARIDIPFTLEGGGGQMWGVDRKGDQSSLPPEMRWDIAPEPQSTMFPVYPFDDLQAGRKGRTRIVFVVGPAGNVVSARLDEATTPEMGRAALAMIDTWGFKPARKKDGSPAFAALSISHDFSINRGDVPVTDSAHDILRLLKRSPKKIATVSDLDATPRPISQRPPIHPSALRAAGKDGAAEIEFFIDEKGDAQLPRIVSATEPEFGYAAAQAVATWRFTPPMRGGKATNVRVQIPITFSLNDGKPQGK